MSIHRKYRKSHIWNRIREIRNSVYTKLMEVDYITLAQLAELAWNIADCFLHLT